MHTADEEITRLADYLMQAWPHEIGKGDPAHGESAVDVAIRLLKRLEDIDAPSQTEKSSMGE